MTTDPRGSPPFFEVRPRIMLDPEEFKKAQERAKAQKLSIEEYLRKLAIDRIERSLHR